ncbi:hypothetical protein TMatcc_004461 [Talaromyces marneffei ATCC 18224]|uniref:ER-bound oxygenase mpaB/mpaB'/Rubber oxygenase catalytic domain-containing protein n=1 Tax=Talaromyces marneffei (strain ATCC 18224 / CBS 334.59 / QM 7333) TaxID=441960 RepID=B6Q4J5_TALMQ|nr:uncharacterized protein EYB26_000594 [Talaromyces marneffei]EEA27254.1 conserved hypothetical protein [Talaromyces marneffei ATCC 18224]QGA12949.1 hypothetical protein EYB26_000594 [Talaromyces marneffei]
MSFSSTTALPVPRASSRLTESYEFYSGDFVRLTGSLDSDSENEMLQSLDKLQQVPKILQEGILLTGGAVAILLQAAAHGMARSASKTGAGGKVTTLAEQLHQSIHLTAIYLYGLTFGTHHQRKQILDRIYASQQQQQQQQQQQRRISHVARNGINHLRPYPQDPKLRLWIAATLYATGTEVYQRIVHEFSFEEAEQAFDEFTALLNLTLNLPKGLWPADRAAFWAYWDEYIEKLDVDSRARPVVHDLEKFCNVPSWVKISMPFMKNITPEMLPPHVREQYGFHSSPTSRFRYKYSMSIGRAIYPVLPRAIRSIPKKRVMKEVAEMLRRP